jgi:hypothetical protein
MSVETIATTYPSLSRLHSALSSYGPIVQTIFNILLICRLMFSNDQHVAFTERWERNLRTSFTIKKKNLSRNFIRGLEVKFTRELIR